MDPDELKNAWQAQFSGRRLVIDEEVILRQVVRGQSDLRAMVFWRDVREIGVALLMIGVFICFYFFFGDHPWPLLLLAASCAWVAGFMFVGRIRHRRLHPHREDSVKACAESTLAEINYQIWLLKNVHWWCLLPTLVTCEMFFAYVAVAVQKPMAFLTPQPVALPVLIGVYFLNRWAVKQDLLPRRREAEALLEDLQQGD